MKAVFVSFMFVFAIAVSGYCQNAYDYILGETIDYNSDKLIVDFRDATITGKVKINLENGTYAIVDVEDGDFNGTYTEYDKDGKVTKTVKYKNGKEVK